MSDELTALYPVPNVDAKQDSLQRDTLRDTL